MNNHATYKRVSRDEWAAKISAYPNRISYRTGIVEPPQEICHSDGDVGNPASQIAYVSYPYGEEPRYYIRVDEDDAAS